MSARLWSCCSMRSRSIQGCPHPRLHPARRSAFQISCVQVCCIPTTYKLAISPISNNVPSTTFILTNNKLSLNTSVLQRPRPHPHFLRLRPRLCDATTAVLERTRPSCRIVCQHHQLINRAPRNARPPHAQKNNSMNESQEYVCKQNAKADILAGVSKRPGRGVLVLLVVCTCERRRRVALVVEFFSADEGFVDGAFDRKLGS